MIIDYDMGIATTYFRGTQDLVYGFVDPFTVPTGEYPPLEERVIPGKTVENVTIDDLLLKKDLMEQAAYQREASSNYPFNDIYYIISEKTYVGDLSRTSYTAESFEAATGYSFGDLGYPDSSDLFEFLADSMNFGYQLIGDNTLANWHEATVGETTYMYCEFSVAKDGVYAIPASTQFEIWDTTNTQVAYPTYTELYSGQTYRLAYPDNTGIPANPYIYHL